MARKYYDSRSNTATNGSFTNYEYEYEISGNTVRRTAVPIPMPEEQEGFEPVKKPEERPLTRQEQKRLQRAKSFNLPSVLVISICMMAAAISCIYFVGAQGELNSHLKTVKKLTNDLSTATERNDSKLQNIEAEIDYTAIYNYALNNLGMTFPGKDQVLWFDSNESEYMIQYEEIPQK